MRCVVQKRKRNLKGEDAQTFVQRSEKFKQKKKDTHEVLFRVNNYFEDQPAVQPADKTNKKQIGEDRRNQRGPNHSQHFSSQRIAISAQDHHQHTTMTTSAEFHFALLRISAAQLLRTVGIDRCAPSVLDTVTDIIMRHLNLLATTSQKLATLSGRREVVIEDLAEAMVLVGVVKPAQYLDTSNYETDLLMALGDSEGIENDDDDDENDHDRMDYEGVADHHANHSNPSDTDRARAEQSAFRKHKITGLDIDGFHNFIDWAKGPVTKDARFISRVAIPPQGPSLNAANVNNPLLSTAPTSASTAAAATTNATAAAATSTTAADTKPDGDGSTAPAPSQPLQMQPSDSPIKTEEWLQHLMKKQVKVGYEKRFQATILASASSSATSSRSGYYHNDSTNDNANDDDVTNEYKISGGPPTLDEAVHTFLQHQTASLSASPLPATSS